jgi:hypothetical protein
LQDPPVQSSTQLPEPPHFIAQEAVFVQVWLQSPPGHSCTVHVPPVQSWKQSPEPVQSVEHAAAPAHDW